MKANDLDKTASKALVTYIVCMYIHTCVK